MGFWRGTGGAQQPHRRAPWSTAGAPDLTSHLSRMGSKRGRDAQLTHSHPPSLLVEPETGQGRAAVTKVPAQVQLADVSQSEAARGRSRRRTASTCARPDRARGSTILLVMARCSARSRVCRSLVASSSTTGSDDAEIVLRRFRVHVLIGPLVEAHRVAGLESPGRPLPLPFSIAAKVGRVVVLGDGPARCSGCASDPAALAGSGTSSGGSIRSRRAWS